MKPVSGLATLRRGKSTGLAAVRLKYILSSPLRLIDNPNGELSRTSTDQSSALRDRISQLEGEQRRMRNLLIKARTEAHEASHLYLGAEAKRLELEQTLENVRARSDGFESNLRVSEEDQRQLRRVNDHIQKKQDMLVDRYNQLDDYRDTLEKELDRVKDPRFGVSISAL